MTLSRYLGRLFFWRFLWFLGGFAGLLLLLDLLERMNDVLVRGGAGAMLHYLLLRLPAVASQILPLSVLLAALTVLLTLARHYEVVAMKSAGLSFYRLLYALVPSAALVGLLQFALVDQVLPRTDRAFHAWWQDTAPPRKADEPRRIWLRSGDVIAAFGAASLDGRSAEHVVLYRRDAGLQLVERISAERAAFGPQGWMLGGVQRFRVGEPGVERLSELAWDTPLRPRDLADTAIRGLRRSSAELRQLIADRTVSTESVLAYRVELQRKFSAPVACLLMLLIAAPVAQGLDRHGGRGMQLALGIAVGFVYLLTDGIVALLGESGIVSPAFAAWGPTLLFAGVGGTVLAAVEQ